MKANKESSYEIKYMKWHRRFIDMAKHVSTWSKDPSTKMGCVIAREKIFISQGINGFPPGVEDSIDRLSNRELKYDLVLHSELNAILFTRENLTGCALYVYPIPPCIRCAVAIIQAGIKYVIYEKIDKNHEFYDRWSASTNLSKQIFEEAGITVIELEPVKD